MPMRLGYMSAMPAHHAVNNGQPARGHERKAVFAILARRAVGKMPPCAANPISNWQIIAPESARHALFAQHKAQQAAPCGGWIIGIPSGQRANAYGALYVALSKIQADQTGGKINARIKALLIDITIMVGFLIAPVNRIAHLFPIIPVMGGLALGPDEIKHGGGCAALG